MRFREQMSYAAMSGACAMEVLYGGRGVAGGRGRREWYATALEYSQKAVTPDPTSSEGLFVAVPFTPAELLIEAAAAVPLWLPLELTNTTLLQLTMLLWRWSRGAHDALPKLL